MCWVISAMKSRASMEPEIRLYDPNGAYVDSASGVAFAEINNLVLPVSGTYTLLAMDSGGTDTGGYCISLICLSPPCDAPPPIPGDINGDGVVGITDFLQLLTLWGPCGNCNSCPADLDGDCTVGINDMLLLLANWTF